MILATTEITCNLNEQETFLFLLKNKLISHQKNRMERLNGASIADRKLQNSNKLKYRDYNSPINLTIPVCTLIPTESKNKTILRITFHPSVSFWIISIAVLYSVFRFGLTNYGTPRFLPSILTPTVFFIGIVFFWRYLSELQGQRIKKEFLRSFRGQIESNATT